MSVSRVLVANRGEIAVRVIKACQALGIETVSVFSEADRHSMAPQIADKAVCIGPPRSADSYLKIGSLIETALGTGCDALHPGYGFLAESPAMAEACAENDIKFVGPSAESIHLMGNKLQAREAVKAYGVPLVPGSPRVGSHEEALSVANEIGFPLLFKAAAGGGGKGIKIVREASELRSTFETAAAESMAAFGDDSLYIERFVGNGRHIEVQVLGDSFGNVVHLGERDCSVQRRYQKIIEEAPAHTMPEALRDQIRETAATAARRIGYESAGTVEFMYDQDAQEFYFLEMNTRIQVEHPVTEMITGVDLVQEQLRIASGNPLPFKQDDIRFFGHAIECRITAESALQNFQPSPGTITEWSPPSGPGIRVDSHCYTGYVVPPFYDSMIAKLIVTGANRAEAIQRMREALRNFRLEGIGTNIPFLEFLMDEQDFQEGDINTGWLERKKLEQFAAFLATR
jgi:acetyl-CoA carboxylase biotin carboxylase subunit